MHGRFPTASRADAVSLGRYWGWLPDTEAVSTHWVPPALDYHPSTGLRSRCGRRCLPSERTHHWRKLPRCGECEAALR
ncbi:hypothetical protein ORV05_24605 [Amycolatopsis cynarae]|uniref:Uncharacterized protein n=1 Tax=Amycolatopsis cynarae TaxID=2995223 RepID=A0ABY7AWS4_9PSEU|nr:hypothetical protein [Amycolatopsis sp. HUAS 11-8]WAL64145.1 hypothetical protein ORV05_24605 [Amycolatopsis sp. HUAS 11-8]